ncbi:hypothetical protein C7N43_39330, partial [Sphingobacteriales bacterium UPWRP_1]
MYDIYEDLTNTDPLNIEPCRNRSFNGIAPCVYIGEYQTLTAWMPPLGDIGATCLASGVSTENNYSTVHLLLMSFPFGKNSLRTQAATLATGEEQRVLTIKEQFTYIEPRPYYMLSSSLFTKSFITPMADEAEDDITQSDNPSQIRTVVPHSVIKHRIFSQCEGVPINILDVVIDNTRGRNRYYPFLPCNDYNDNMCKSTEAEHDIAVVPFVDINTTDGNEPDDFNYLNYFPSDEAPQCSSFTCMAWDGTSPDLCAYMHPVPFSLIGTHLRGNSTADRPLGYYPQNADGTNLQPQDGIKHTYIVDKNY